MVFLNSIPGLSRALIFVNGIVDDYRSLANFIKPSDTIICVDGGLAHAVKLALPVAVLLGDMDSVQNRHLKHLGENTQVLTFSAEKDQTDMELALDWASDAGFVSVVIIGINGGRLDHTLTNIHLLSRGTWLFETCFWEARQYTWILKSGQNLNFLEKQGHTLSLIPMSETVSGITIEGMKYPLDNESLSFGSTRGISNEIVDASAKVVLQAGVLVVMLSQ